MSATWIHLRAHGLNPLASPILSVSQDCLFKVLHTEWLKAKERSVQSPVQSPMEPGLPSKGPQQPASLLQPTCHPGVHQHHAPEQVRVDAIRSQRHSLLRLKSGNPGVSSTAPALEGCRGIPSWPLPSIWRFLGDLWDALACDYDSLSEAASQLVCLPSVQSPPVHSAVCILE